MPRGTRALSAVPRALVVVAVVAALLGSSAHAQVCAPELEETLSVSADPAVVTGLDAARALQRAVALVEPALPALVGVDRLPIAADHPDAQTVRFLAERRLLPAAWTPDRLAPAVWREMLRRFLDWYALDPPAPNAPAPVDDAALASELSDVLDAISAAIRPAALFATDPDDRSRLAFRALIWNWSVYPRLLVFRPAAEETIAESTEAALASLETCVRRIRHWFSAPAPTARELFLANQRARMVVVGGEAAAPDSAAARSSADGAVADGAAADGSTAEGSAAANRWPWWVPPGEELSVFDFAHPRVADLDSYSVVFDGPSLGVAGLVRLLPSVRTNVSPLGLRPYLQTPP